MQLTFYQPLLWLMILGVLAIGLAFSLVDRPAKLKGGSFALRALGILSLIFALCRPVILSDHSDLHVIFLVDVSESVDLEASIQSLDSVKEGVATLGEGDSFSLFAVGNGVRSFENVESLSGVLKEWQKGIADDAFRSASKISDALLRTRLDFPAGKSKRVIILTDGQETHGNLAEATGLLKEERVDIQWQVIPGLAKPEAAIGKVEASTPNAFEGEVVRMKVTVAANQAMGAKLRILHRGVAVQDLDMVLDASDENIAEMDVDMITPGDSLWTAELLPEKDYFPLNNQSGVTVRVTGKPRVLALHQKPRDLRSFSRAMDEQDFEIDVRGNRGMPETMEALLEFDAIILADISATDLTPRQMDLLKRYVIDFGGGLAMMGSENSFGLGGYYKTPVEEVIPLISRFEKEKEKPSLAMALVMDKSGSMEGLPIELARQAAKATVELLSGRDQIAVVGFDSNAHIISELRSASETDSIHAAIDSMAAGGGTDVYSGMIAGKEILDNAIAKIKHMIVLSDGQTHEADFQGLTQGMVDSGITVSAVALGEGAARELLAGIADTGKGRYYETMDPSTVPQIFTKETMQASRSAIKEDLYGTVQSSDHPLLSGYEDLDLPFTLGYVMTEPKPTSEVILLAETGDPLLAIGRYGLGMGLAYTSDLTEKWGGEWLAWEECGKFWAQTLRAVVRKADSDGMKVQETVVQDVWKIEILRTDPNRLPVSRIRWNAQALDQNGRSLPVDISEVGLGRYRAQLPLENHERLTLRLHDQENDKLKVLHFQREYPPEYALSTKLPEVFEELPQYEAAGLRDALSPVRTRESVAHYFYLAALACLLGGIVLRRI